MTFRAARFLIAFVRSYWFTALLVTVGLGAYLAISAAEGRWGTYDAVWDFWAAISLAVLHALMLNAGRITAFEQRLAKRGAARSQERHAAKALAHCFVCTSEDRAWAYPLLREVSRDGSVMLLPPWLATCDSCHSDIEHGRVTELESKLADAYPKPRDHGMRGILPVFQAARNGEAVPHTSTDWPAPQPR